MEYRCSGELFMKEIVVSIQCDTGHPTRIALHPATHHVSLLTSLLPHARTTHQHIYFHLHPKISANHLSLRSTLIEPRNKIGQP